MEYTKIFNHNTYRVILKEEESKMDQCLFDAKDILDTLNIPFYLCTGTALGFVRDGGFIPHDYDIDIAIDESECNDSKIIQSFCKSGKFSKYSYRYLNNLPIEISFTHNPTGIRIDIFVTYHYENGSYHILWDVNNQYGTGAGNPILMNYSPFQKSILTYKGRSFSCPDSNYLSQTYGSTWKTPIDFKKLGGDPYLASLNTTHRPNLLSVEASRAILEKKFGKF